MSQRKTNEVRNIWLFFGGGSLLIFVQFANARCILWGFRTLGLKSWGFVPLSIACSWDGLSHSLYSSWSNLMGGHHFVRATNINIPMCVVNVKRRSWATLIDLLLASAWSHGVARLVYYSYTCTTGTNMIFVLWTFSLKSSLHQSRRSWVLKPQFHSYHRTISWARIQFFFPFIKKTSQCCTSLSAKKMLLKMMKRWGSDSRAEFISYKSGIYTLLELDMMLREIIFGS
jgi:hypothetical protein